MQFERDRLLAAIDTCRSRQRGVVDALVLDDRDLWIVVARHGEEIEEWLHGFDGEEVAPLRICRSLLGDGQVVLDDADPDRDHLLSDLEAMD